MKAMRSSTVSTGAMLLPTMVTVAAAVAFLVYGPIPQLADYHNFADQRMLLGVSHAFDVLSNAGFLLVGLAGVRRLWRSRERAVADGAWYGYIAMTWLSYPGRRNGTNTAEAVDFSQPGGD